MGLIKKKLIYQTSEVFIPGGLPELTYCPRKDRNLERSLKEAKNRLCKLVMITGTTKSGKTVLTNKFFPRDKCVWFDGGSFSSEDDFWNDIAGQLDIFPEESINERKDVTNQAGIGLSVEKQLVLFKVKGEGKYSRSKKRGKSRTISRSMNPKTLALSEFRKKAKPFIIDDFHYIPRENQASIVRAIKALIFSGLPVIFIAIPHRRFDAVKVKREMTGRITTIEVPSWTNKELRKIAELGFPLLNIKISNPVISTFAREAIGSPHLMQQFCREVCNTHRILKTSKEAYSISHFHSSQLFKNVAQNTGKVIFDKLSKGPRQRADRVVRIIKGGFKTDIYGLVLHALMELRPGIQTIDYETLRAKVRDISEESLPQASEITRVLDKMSQIAMSDESSVPVIDYEREERVLHITDPFFAYYLRWGVDSLEKQK